MNTRGKLGRPYGSRTFRETPAVKRARQFFELQYEGMKPTAAAKAVAAEWQVSETTIFSDYSRHRARLMTGMEKRIRENKVWFGRLLMQEHPDIAAEFIDVFVREFRAAYAETARKLDSLGDSVGAQAVRDFDPVSALGDDWVACLGTLYLLMLDRTRNTKGR